MDLESYYEISRAAEYIHSLNFSRVALQFPDDLLKDSTSVVSALKNRLCYIERSDDNGSGKDNEVRFFVMADCTYGSCCVDEVGASHVSADCVLHYGHTCLSPTSTIPTLFVFGKASICVADCVKSLSHFSLINDKRLLVLFGLEYAYSVLQIKEALFESLASESLQNLEVHFAEVLCSVINPSKDNRSSDGLQERANCDSDNKSVGYLLGNRHSIGGLIWNLPEGHNMEDYTIFWIGAENSAFANVVLTFNGCEIVRYDAQENCIVTDSSQQRRILKRRYYLVEKAKDANIVGILVGTLGLAGYLDIIHQMKELITGAGKKAYTLVMGRPNPAKLANFPECDVFVHVACAQTALLDSKEYLSPVITPFEAMLAFDRGSQWTGDYTMEFRNLIKSSQTKEKYQMEEARYSFMKGGYVEDINLQENVEDEEESFALATTMEKALQLQNNPSLIVKGTARSGAEFFASRSYQGLDIQSHDSKVEPYLIGRSGRASGYDDEKVSVDKKQLNPDEKERQRECTKI